MTRSSLSSLSGSPSSLSPCVRRASRSNTTASSSPIVRLGGIPEPGVGQGWSTFSTYLYSTQYTLPGPANSGVNFLRPYASGTGGMVIAPIRALDAGQLKIMDDAIDSLDTSGTTPLETTLYEAGLYFRGGAVDYGRSSSPTPSVAGGCASSSPRSWA